MLPVADLHCDLLSFLADNAEDAYLDPRSNASYPQMKEGGVAFQALAIFTETGRDSFIKGKKQIAALEKLLLKHPQKFTLFNPLSPIEQGKAIAVLPAFENGSSFCSEDMPLEEGLRYLDSVLRTFGRILYISLTWDGENRFGGGNGSKAGLKEDGKRVLDWMADKKIAVDFSHTSDFLADDILNYIDKKSLSVPVLASHSNVRSIERRPRNMPDFLIKEIIVRKGLTGLNLFAPFIGSEPEMIALHVENLLTMGGEDHIVFGADFFPLLSLGSTVKQKYGTDTSFFEEFPNSSGYPKVLSILEKKLHLNEKILRKISIDNFQTYANNSLV